MLTTSTRATLAAALNTVSGVKGYAYRPTAPRAGDAWPQVATADRAVADAWSISWRILLVLPPDEKGASILFDIVVPLLVDALDPVAYVDSVTPIVLTTSAGDLNAIEIRARGE
jgi:hypothetical protein